MGFDAIHKSKTWRHIANRKIRLVLLRNSGVWDLDYIGKSDIEQSTTQVDIDLSTTDTERGVVV